MRTNRAALAMSLQLADILAQCKYKPVYLPRDRDAVAVEALRDWRQRRGFGYVSNWLRAEVQRELLSAR